MKNLILFLLFSLNSQSAFAGWVDVVADPPEPKLEMENTSITQGNGIERILVAPWFKINLKVFNDHGRDVVLRNLQVDIVSADGKTDSHPVYYWMEAFPLPAPESTELKDVYIDFLPKDGKPPFKVTIHVIGWFGTVEDAQENLDRTTTVVVK